MQRVQSSALVRDVNRTAVLAMLGRSGPLSRADLARHLRLSPPTVTAITRDLLADGLVTELEDSVSRGGRPARLLGIVAHAGHALGVKIARDHLTIVTVQLDGTITNRDHVEFDAHAPNPIERLADHLHPRVQHGTEPLLGVGLGLPGAVHTRHGLVDSPTLGWKAAPVTARLEERLSVPVLADNDVNTVALAERLYGRGRDYDDFLAVTIGRGVGLAIVLGGEIYRGIHGSAGEFGHLPVVADGRQCGCGNQGCLEAYVADPALVDAAVHSGILTAGDTVETLTSKADTDQRAADLFATAGATLGRAVAGLVNIFDPGAVLMIGEGLRAWTHLEPEFSRSLERHSFPTMRGVPVEVDSWDDDSWALGAAALVLAQPFVDRAGDAPVRDSVRSRLAGRTS